MATKLLFVSILLLNCTNMALAKPSRRLQLEIFDMECTPLTAIVRTFNCSQQRAALSGYYISLELILAEDLKDHFDLQVHIDGQFLNTNNVVNILDYKADICQNMQTAFKNNIMRMLVEELRRSSNLPYKCPFISKKSYKVDNFTLTRDIFPSFTPESNFTVILNIFHKNIEIANITITAAISLKSMRSDNKLTVV